MRDTQQKNTTMVKTTKKTVNQTPVAAAKWVSAKIAKKKNKLTKLENEIAKRDGLLAIIVNHLDQENQSKIYNELDGEKLSIYLDAVDNALVLKVKAGERYLDEGVVNDTEGRKWLIQRGEAFGNKIEWFQPENVRIKWSIDCNLNGQEGLVFAGEEVGYAGVDITSTAEPIYTRYPGTVRKNQHVFRICKNEDFKLEQTLLSL